jgi:large subunit ribosomal protein L11
MAKKVTGVVRLRIPAGRAADCPLVARLLGPRCVSIASFCTTFDAATIGTIGLMIPVVITFYADRSWSFVTHAPCERSAHATVDGPADAILSGRP